VSGSGRIYRTVLYTIPLSRATLGKLLTHMLLSPSSIIWYQPMGGDAFSSEGNHRSGVAVATHHRH